MKRVFRVLILLIAGSVGCAMAREEVRGLGDEVVLWFSYQGWGLSGGLNGFSVSRDNTYVLRLTNIAGTESFGEGGGEYRGTLGVEGVALKEALRALLCDHPEIGQTPMLSPGSISSYGAMCPNGRSVSGSVDAQVDLPKGAEQLMPTFGKLAVAMYKSAVDHPVKLDVDYDIEARSDQFFVTLRFINNGMQPITIKSPSTWDGAVPSYIPIGKSAHLVVGDFEVVLGGQGMLNAKDYPNDTMTIPAGESRKAEFYAIPDAKATKGKYPSGGRIFIEGIEPQALATALDFHAINREREVPRSYPTTSEEWEAYEATHRKYGVAASVGKLVPENGYYRAEAYVADARRSADKVTGRFVTRLRKGDVAPQVAREIDTQGRAFPASPKYASWSWVADYSSVVETQPRQPCPKSGVWFARVPSEVPNSAYFQRDTMVTVKYGERMPTVGLADPAAEDRVRWLWIRPIE